MHPLSGPPLGPMGRHLLFRAGELSGPSEPPAIFEGPPRQNPWAHAPPPQGPHLVLPLRSPHSHRLGLAGLLKANPNPRSATERPFPRGLAPQHWILGTPESQHQTHTAPGRPLGPRGAIAHSGRENRQGPQSPWRHSKAPHAKTLGPTLPLPCALISARQSACRTAMGSGQPASWGLTLTLGWPPSGPSQGAWHRSVGD